MLLLLCLVAAVTSGGALLLKLYGVMPMHVAAGWLTIPGMMFLAAAAVSARQSRPDLFRSIVRGAVGGFLGTVAYDVVRIPFLMAGIRVFAPISCYGIWVCDADAWSPATEVAGWLYHFSNGITFGIMYALVAMGRHWGWAILWGLTLETIALASPFRVVFEMAVDPLKIAIAYMGHVAYGYPLGRYTQNAAVSQPEIQTAARQAAALAIVSAIAAIGVFVSGKSAVVSPRHMNIEGPEVNPSWLRVQRGSSIQFSSSTPAVVQVRHGGTYTAGGDHGPASVRFPDPGIFPVLVRSHPRARASFVIVEPAEEALPRP